MSLRVIAVLVSFEPRRSVGLRRSVVIHVSEYPLLYVFLFCFLHNRSVSALVILVSQRVRLFHLQGSRL